MLREGRGRSGHGERGDDRDTDRGTVWVPVLFMGSGSMSLKSNVPVLGLLVCLPKFYCRILH